MLQSVRVRCRYLLLVRHVRLCDLAMHHDGRSSVVSLPTAQLPDAELGQFIVPSSTIN